MSHLDPDQVIINRHELARLHEAERQLNELRGRMAEEDRRVIDAMSYIQAPAVLQTKDGLMACYRLPKGHPLQAPIRIPVQSSILGPEDFTAAMRHDAVGVRTYRFRDIIGNDRTPLYVEQ